MTMAYADDGKALLNNLVLGTGVGASATGLYYLAKKLRKQFEEQLEKNKPQAPNYADAALGVPNLIAPEQKKVAFDAYTVATPLATGAAGAILASALSDNKNKRRNALLGAGAGALAGAGLNTKPVHEFVGKWGYPTNMFPGMGDHAGKSWMREGFKNVMIPAGAGLGVLGGKTLYDIAAAPYAEVEKKKEQHNVVESARQQYFDELLHDDDKSPSKKEKRSSISETLDAVFAVYAEKASAWYDYINPKNLIEANNTLYAAAMLGGGVIGGKYMYDKTRSESAAKNMAKAIAAKERMKTNLPVWVDPQELAQVKDVAKPKEPIAEGV